MNPYLLNVAAAMQQPAPDPFAAGAAAVGIAPPPPAAMQAPAAPLYDGRNSASSDAMPIRLPGVQPAPELPPAGPPLPPPASPSPPHPAVQPEQPGMQQAISLASRGGMIPAHEATRLGPTQWKALDASNEAQGQAIGTMAANGLAQAARDEDVYLRHALDARAREEAAQQVAMAREDELRMRAADFDRQARELTKEKLDPGRLWASKSTPQKVATFVSIALGGFLSGARGGENLAMQRVNEEIERDIKAQEMGIMLKRTRLDASHNAFGMALQQYQSVDAARAFARVSAMDAVAAEIQRQASQSKGTDVANRAQAALAELQQARADQILKGIAYIPSQYTAPTYRVANRLGTYTAREIDDKQIAPEEGRGFELQKIDRTGEWKIREEGAKVEAGREAKQHDSSVVLPSGERVVAPGAVEAKELRDLAAQDLKVRTLVARAKQLREEGFRANPGNKGELESIQQQLRTSFSVAAKLGALSKDDIKITDGAIGELTNPYALSSAPDRALQSYADMVRHEVANRVKTYQGGSESAPRATGVVPSGFKPGLAK